GTLRRFTQMVFEVTYVDPSTAPAATLAADTPPVVDSAQLTLVAPASTATRQAGTPTLRLSASVRATSGGLREVSATYTVDGASWRRQALALNPAAGQYETIVPFTALGHNVYAFLETIDNAGNVT